MTYYNILVFIQNSLMVHIPSALLPVRTVVLFYLLYFKPISDTPDRLNILWLGSIELYLLADLLDMHRHCGDIADGIHIPDLTEQFFLGIYMVRILRMREAKVTSTSDYVIADSEGQPLSYSQFKRVWQYIVVRSTKERTYYKYVNGQSIKYTVKPTLGTSQKNNPRIVYTLDFEVTPHQLRHTYITNLLYAGVDPKTVQYLAGHENSKTTMDIYAKVKYNKPEELFDVVNQALRPSDLAENVCDWVKG